jgi:hypothetical protein
VKRNAKGRIETKEKELNSRNRQKSLINPNELLQIRRDIKMRLFKRKKSKTPLYDGLLSVCSPEQKKEIESHFSGMGDHEILAIFRGPHFKPAMQKINRYSNSKPKQIRVYAQLLQPSGGCMYYIRGTFTKEDATFILHGLKSCMQNEDSLRVTVPE